MRDNFRPTIRLATNILLVIGTFAVALNIAPISKRAKLKNPFKEIQYTWHSEYEKIVYQKYRTLSGLRRGKNLIMR